MTKMEIRKMTVADASAVVTLNRAVEQVTSPMDLDRFSELHDLSCFKRVVEMAGQVVAFVIVMSHGQPYDNANYQWFDVRFDDFFYIDRIVVSDVCRGRGVGRALYSHIEEQALSCGVLILCAEIDTDPPNFESLAFHERLGFCHHGSRVLENGKKVSMQLRSLGSSCT